MSTSRRSLPMGVLAVEVVLSGRVLALKWHSDALLFRAARQTVVRSLPDPPPAREPDDPDRVLARVRTPLPQGEGPCRLRLPVATPSPVGVSDDAGFCALVDPPHVRAGRALVPCR